MKEIAAEDHEFQREERPGGNKQKELIQRKLPPVKECDYSEKKTRWPKIMKENSCYRPSFIVFFFVIPVILWIQNEREKRMDPKLMMSAVGL